MSRGTLPLCGTPAHTAPKSHACGLPGWPRTPPSHSCLRSVNQEAPKRLLSYLIPTGFPLWFKPRTRPVRGSFETLAPFLVWFSPQHLRQQCAGTTRPRPSSFAKPRLPFGSQVGWPEARRTDNLQPNPILFSNIDKTSTHASRCLPAFAGASIDFHGRLMRFGGPRGAAGRVIQPSCGQPGRTSDTPSPRLRVARKGLHSVSAKVASLRLAREAQRSLTTQSAFR